LRLRQFKTNFFYEFPQQHTIAISNDYNLKGLALSVSGLITGIFSSVHTNLEKSFNRAISISI
jgi:hypothetical protein